MIFKVGDEVYWHNCDDDICSGVYHITAIHGEILVLENDFGSLVEANNWECYLTHD